jgi:hypothetical protein
MSATVAAILYGLLCYAIGVLTAYARRPVVIHNHVTVEPAVTRETVKQTASELDKIVASIYPVGTPRSKGWDVV